MSMRPARRFTLADLMILVAGIALGFWIAPEGSVFAIRHAIRVVGETRSASVAGLQFGPLLTHTQPVPAVWTLTVLALTLKGGGPLRRLASRPGFMACAAATLAMLVIGPLTFAAGGPNLAPGLPIGVRLQFWMGHSLTFQKAECGVAVAGAWLALALGGRWRPRPEWIDRGGQALGVYWMAMIVVTWLDPIL